MQTDAGSITEQNDQDLDTKDPLLNAFADPADVAEEKAKDPDEDVIDDHRDESSGPPADQDEDSRRDSQDGGGVQRGRKVRRDHRPLRRVGIRSARGN